MSDQVTLPPGITPAQNLVNEWRDSPRQTIREMVESAQRDAVMAERRHVALTKAKQVCIGFGERLRGLLAEFNADSASNTPDFVLAGYLQRCLENWNATSRARCQHLDGIEIKPGAGHCASNRGEVLPEFCYCCTAPLFYCIGSNKFCTSCHGLLRNQATV